MVHSISSKTFFVRCWLTPITPRRCSRHCTCRCTLQGRRVLRPTTVSVKTFSLRACSGQPAVMAFSARLALATPPDSTGTDVTEPSPTDPSTARLSRQNGWWRWWGGEGTTMQRRSLSGNRCMWCRRLTSGPVPGGAARNHWCAIFVIPDGSRPAPSGPSTAHDKHKGMLRGCGTTQSNKLYNRNSNLHSTALDCTLSPFARSP